MPAGPRDWGRVTQFTQFCRCEWVAHAQHTPGPGGSAQAGTASSAGAPVTQPEGIRAPAGLLTGLRGSLCGRGLLASRRPKHARTHGGPALERNTICNVKRNSRTSTSAPNTRGEASRGACIQAAGMRQATRPARYDAYMRQLAADLSAGRNHDEHKGIKKEQWFSKGSNVNQSWNDLQLAALARHSGSNDTHCILLFCSSVFGPRHWAGRAPVGGLDPHAAPQEHQPKCGQRGQVRVESFLSGRVPEAGTFNCRPHSSIMNASFVEVPPDILPACFRRRADTSAKPSAHAPSKEQAVLGEGEFEGKGHALGCRWCWERNV